MQKVHKKKTLSLKEAQKGYENHLTLGDLRKFIENNKSLSNDTPVFCERVEDKYFNDNWAVLDVESEYDGGEYFQSWCIYHKDGIVLISNFY